VRALGLPVFSKKDHGGERASSWQHFSSQRGAKEGRERSTEGGVHGERTSSSGKGENFPKRKAIGSGNELQPFLKRGKVFQKATWEGQGKILGKGASGI